MAINGIITDRTRAIAVKRWHQIALCAVLATLSGCAADEHRQPVQPAQATQPVQTAPPNWLPPLPGPPPQPQANVRTVAYNVAELPPPEQLPMPPARAASPTLPIAEPQAFGGLSLADAMAVTLQSDAKLRGAMEAIRQAEGDLLTSSLPPNPTVQINGDFLPVRPFTPTRPGGPPELDVIGSYPIDWYIFGKRAAAMATAQDGVAVSNADYCDQVRQRLANTASTFYDVLEARATLWLSEEDLANLQQVESRTAQGVKLGGLSPIDLERIGLAVFEARRDVRTRAAALTTAKAQFRAAIGRCGDMTGTDAAGNLDVPRTAPPPPLAEAVALAEHNRPDIISLRRQIDKARSGVVSEETKARAQVTPALGYQYQWQEEIGVADAPSYTAQLGVSVPLFDRNQGNIAKAKSMVAQSCYNLQAQLVQTEADVEQAVAEYQAAEESVRVIGPKELAGARSVRDRTVQRYSLGRATMLEVLDAERAYRDTHRTCILSQSAYWHALHRLNAAVGQQVLQ